MVLALFLRLLKLMAISFVCSLFIHFTNAEMFSGQLTLVLSLVLFLLIEIFEAYKFSYKFWKIQDYFLGILLPEVIYAGLALLTCWVGTPVLFNRFFLPLRFANCFGFHTKWSIVIVGSVFIVLIAATYFIAARAGRVHFKNFGGEDVE